MKGRKLEGRETHYLSFAWAGRGQIGKRRAGSSRPGQSVNVTGLSGLRSTEREKMSGRE
jgi:hypothetical protein